MGAVNHARAGAPVNVWILTASQQGAPSLTREQVHFQDAFVV